MSRNETWLVSVLTSRKSVVDPGVVEVLRLAWTAGSGAIIQPTENREYRNHSALELTAVVSTVQLGSGSPTHGHTGTVAMLKPMSPLVLYLSIVTFFSLAAIACSSGDGEDTPLDASVLLEGVGANIELTSTELSNGAEIPGVYTCYGLDVSPPVSWSGVPEGALGLALIVDEPDEGHRVHWVIYDLPPDATELPGRISFTQETVLGRGKQGRNDFRRMGWAGPCPDPGGDHEGSYLFNIYALDTVLGIEIEGGGREGMI